MIPAVYSLTEARQWFLEHSSGSVKCIDGNREEVCSTYAEAVTFYTLNK